MLIFSSFIGIGVIVLILSFILIIFLVAVDQYTKYLASAYLMGAESITVINGLLGLRYVENTGAAFSMFSGGTTMLIVVTSAALMVMAYFIFIKKYGNCFERFCFLLILAGGIGNLIDRVASGFVVDFFEFLFMNFAVFNMADVFVCVGVGLFAIYTIYTEFAKKGKS